MLLLFTDFRKIKLKIKKSSLYLRTFLSFLFAQQQLHFWPEKLHRHFLYNWKHLLKWTSSSCLTRLRRPQHGKRCFSTFWSFISGFSFRTTCARLLGERERFFLAGLVEEGCSEALESFCKALKLVLTCERSNLFKIWCFKLFQRNIIDSEALSAW